MATAVRYKNGFLTLRGVTADWGLESSIDLSLTGSAHINKYRQLRSLNELAQGPRLDSIEFIPGEGNAGSLDTLFVKEDSASGPVIAYFRNGQLGGDKDNKGERQVKNFIKYFHGKPTRPYIDQDICSLSSGSTICINFR
jgi:hypothetical protein